MGENVLQNQVKNFMKGADRSLKSMSAPMLFDREEIVTTTYMATPANGSDVEPGASLLGHISANGQSVNLADGHRIVATIEGDGAKSLLAALKEPGSPGVAPMSVIEISPISGFIKAKIESPEDNNE